MFRGVLLFFRCDDVHQYFGDPKNGGTCYCESVVTLLTRHCFVMQTDFHRDCLCFLSIYQIFWHGPVLVNNGKYNGRKREMEREREWLNFENDFDVPVIYCFCRSCLAFVVWFYCIIFVLFLQIAFQQTISTLSICPRMRTLTTPKSTFLVYQDLWVTCFSFA